jgi:hypothetical protein
MTLKNNLLKDSLTAIGILVTIISIAIAINSLVGN